MHRLSETFKVLIILTLLQAFIPKISLNGIVIDVETSEIINNQEDDTTHTASIMPQTNHSTTDIKVFPLHPIPQDCIFVKTEEGIYSFESHGNSSIICGLYLIAKPEYYIELEFLRFDVSCTKNGLLSVIDGWELNGQFFPGIEDHPIPRNARYHEFCGHTKPRKIFKMSQNAGLIEFRIPVVRQGFVVKVKFVENPKPCNVVIQDFMGIYTIRNYGRRINCTVSMIFESSFKLLSMNVGKSYRPLGNLLSLRNYVVETGIIKKCKKRGMQDYVELRGGNGLDPHLMTVAEDMCGLRSIAFQKKFTVKCPNTAVRLVSSGNFDNLVEFAFNAVDTYQQAPSLVCPESYQTS